MVAETARRSRQATCRSGDSGHMLLVIGPSYGGGNLRRHGRVTPIMRVFWLLLVLVAVLTMGLVPASGHEQQLLWVRDRDWHHANYWEEPQKLLVKGRFFLRMMRRHRSG